MGKSYVCKQLLSCFRGYADHPALLPFGSFYHLTSFEEYALGMSVLPDWWSAWLNSTSKACWIVDAIDEDERKGHNHIFSVLTELEKLSIDNRARLVLIAMCRENETPVKVVERLSELYGPVGGAELVRVKLAPMDSASAHQYLGDSFELVCDLIRANGLESVAGLPTVLDCLKRQSPGTKLSCVEVWREVLFDLLKDKRRDDQLMPAEPPIESQFAAATRMAAVLTLGGYDEILSATADIQVPSIDAIFSPSHPKTSMMRATVPHVLRSSMLQRTPTGIRFCQFQTLIRGHYWTLIRGHY